jgi:drug/metabolite transporter (DMT)-like permease
MLNKKTKQTAVLELVLASLLWGFSFIATIWAFDALDALSTVTVRFVIVLVAGLPFLWLPSLASSRSWAQARLVFWPGIFMGLSMVLQTWGLRYTTATKSSFITVLYVLMVPFIERVFLRRKLPPKIFLFAFMGLFGTALICQFQPFQPSLLKWNIGDALTFGCAIAGALQIIFVGNSAAKIKSAFAFNLYQTLWALVIPILAFPIFGGFRFDGFTALSLFGLLFIAFGSTLVAFMLQVRAQKVLSNSLASMLFLLESPFAAVFAALFLSEQLDLPQWAGAVLIMAAALGAVRAAN